MELVDYTISRGIQDELAFCWWIPSAIKKRRSIISKIKTKKRHTKVTRFGIKTPKNMKEARVLEAENENNVWRMAE